MQNDKSRNKGENKKATKTSRALESQYKKVNHELRAVTGEFKCFLPGYN